ncbi:MAG: F0F1 ATP synthase subunit epsilon [Planctomycetaceae bacterium]|nr:F0F1 ATP synthase subunit epsilon [Planctomycetaceae bacterium]MCA9044225.1 F0F1 ATP synthase subunit epsilon [Planctomycetaceae bacterium]
MNLKILLPTAVVLDEPVTKIVAEGEDGFFCLLPRHVDFLSALAPGILTFTTADELNHYVAIGEGILVKTGDLVRVSTRHAVRGTNLGELRETVAREFERIDDRERAARSAIAKLEADLARRFLGLGDHPRV